MLATTSPSHGDALALPISETGTRDKLHTTELVIDIVVYLLIAGFTALQFALYRRADDFYTGDTTYIELARSLVRSGWYGFDFRPETTLPPGYPFILAGICSFFGCTYAVVIRSIAVFCGIGFVATYQFLQREHGRATAAAITLILISSPVFFWHATRYAFSDLPYFATSMIALALMTRLDYAEKNWGPLAATAGVLFALSVLIRTAGFTLIAGTVVWIAAGALSDLRAAVARVRKFAPVLLVALVALAGWTVWAKQHEQRPEWPIGGYPLSYLAQMEVKSGNNPELGTMTLADVPARLETNLSDRMVGFLQMVARRGYRRLFLREWFSPWVVAPALLIVLGLGTSIRNRGGRFYDWYFMAHEAMYLIWPWDLEERFLLPVAPLACLYLWRGARTLQRWAAARPREVAAVTLAVAVILGGVAAVRVPGAHALQSRLALSAWAAIALAAAMLLFLGKIIPSLAQRFAARREVAGMVLSAHTALVATLVAALVLFGLAKEIRLGVENLRFDVTRDSAYPPIEAAKWLRSHTGRDTVVMARQLDVVYHYAGRRVIWFPPISNPTVLMDGIRRYHVNYIVVPDHIDDSYWKPTEIECFGPLLRAYPMALHLIHQGPHEKTFAVTPGA